MKKFIATCTNRHKVRTLKVDSISASKAIKTAAKVFGVKMNKVSVRQID